MTTWAVTYKFDGVLHWETVKAAHTWEAKTLFLDSHRGYNVEIIDVDEFDPAIYLSDEELERLRWKFTALC